MNISRRAFLTGLTAAATLPLLSRCSFSESPLIIVSHSWTGYELMFLARQQGWLDKRYLQLLETSSATESIRALVNNQAQGAALTLDEVLRVRALGIDLTCVLVFDVSAGADMVLAKSNINNLSDLKGKRIGFEKSALGYLMFYKLLQAAAIPSTAVVQVSVNYDQHVRAWNNNELDVLITFEPVASQLLEQGAQKIFDSREMPHMIFDVLAVKADVITEYPEQLGYLIAQHFRARQYFYHNPQDAAYKMAMRMNLSATSVLNSFRGLVIPNPQANQKYLSHLDGSLITAAETLSTIMVNAGILAKPDSLKNLLDARFLPKGK